MLGRLLVKKPREVQSLLQEHGSGLSSNPSEAQLAKALMDGISSGNTQFHFWLSKLLIGDYDSFNPGNVNVGTDPVSAIAGALGSIANVIGNAQQKKQRKQDAQNEMLRNILAYKAAQAAPAQTQSDSPRTPTQTKKYTNLYILLGALALVSVVIFISQSSLLMPNKTP